MKKFYNDRGFPDAKVIASLGGFKDGGDSAFLTYSIYEGPSFDFGEVSIKSMVKGISPSIYEKSVVASKGDKFNSSLIKETLDNIKTVSVSNGYPFLIGKVDQVRNFKKREIGLIFKVIEGPKLFVEQIEISGNTHTRDNVIRREFKVEEGDAFDPSMLKRSEEKLQSLGYFESVKVNVRQGSSPQNAIVDIDVKEAPTGSLSLGLGTQLIQMFLLSFHLVSQILEVLVKVLGLAYLDQKTVLLSVWVLKKEGSLEEMF